MKKKHNKKYINIYCFWLPAKQIRKCTFKWYVMNLVLSLSRIDSVALTKNDKIERRIKPINCERKEWWMKRGVGNRLVGGFRKVLITNRLKLHTINLLNHT